MREMETKKEAYVADEDNIYVCRCEEVTVGDIKRAIAEGADSIKTGDTTLPSLWIISAVLAAGAVLTLGYRKKKR